MDKKNDRISRAAFIIALVALAVSAVNVVLCLVRNVSVWSALVLFFAMIAILCANIVMRRRKKKQDGNAE